MNHHTHHPCNDCPDGWEFDDDISTNDITTIDNSSDLQPPIEDDPPNNDIFSSVSPPLRSFGLKHPHHPCVCPDGWKFNEDIISDDDTTTATEIASDDSQPFSFDDKPDSDFDTDTTSKFILDLEAKMATDDDTAATESIVFDDKPAFDDKTDDDSSNEDDSSTVYDL